MAPVFYTVENKLADGSVEVHNIVLAHIVDIVLRTALTQVTLTLTGDRTVNLTGENFQDIYNELRSAVTTFYGEPVA